MIFAGHNLLLFRQSVYKFRINVLLQLSVGEEEAEYPFRCRCRRSWTSMEQKLS